MIERDDHPVSTKFGRFAIVGLLNTAIDLASFTALVALGLPALAANFLGWAVAVIFSFAVNSRWTFERAERFNLHRAFAWTFLKTPNNHWAHSFRKGWYH